jgi:hypothetical protein
VILFKGTTSSKPTIFTFEKYKLPTEVRRSPEERKKERIKKQVLYLQKIS